MISMIYSAKKQKAALIGISIFYDQVRKLQKSIELLIMNVYQRIYLIYMYNQQIQRNMYLRELQNWQPLSTEARTETETSKIEHQIENQGCRCDLCQKIVINEMKVIKYEKIEDRESQLTKGVREQYFSRFAIQFNQIDKMQRKVKVIFPQLCVFEKGTPICLISKKRQTLPMKLIKNKEKLNGFEIHNFFVDGFTFHNNFKERINLQLKNRNYKENMGSAVAKYRRDHFNYEEALKSQCVVLTKFDNGSCQMMTPVELSNLFKSKQRKLRQQIMYITTMVCSSNYNEIRINVKLSSLQGSKLFDRAKNEVKMINEDIKPKDFMFIPERDERKFEQNLKEEDHKKYLQYLSLKLVLLFSLRTDVLFNDSIFKFVKDEIDTYYLVDIQVYSKGRSSRIWGNCDNTKTFVESPVKDKKRVRPTSSPERLQKIRAQQKRPKEQIEQFTLEFPL